MEPLPLVIPSSNARHSYLGELVQDQERQYEEINQSSGARKEGLLNCCIFAPLIVNREVAYIWSVTYNFEWSTTIWFSLHDLVPSLFHIFDKFTNEKTRNLMFFTHLFVTSASLLCDMYLEQRIIGLGQGKSLPNLYLPLSPLLDDHQIIPSKPEINFPCVWWL